MFGIIPYTNRPATRANAFMNPFNDEFFRSFFAPSVPSDFRVDVEDKGGRYILKADLPGVERENVKITVENGVLTISAVTETSSEENRGNYVCRERRTGSVRRAFSLEGIAEEGITAAYKDGVLTLELPKAQAEVPGAREIAIN